MKPSPNNDGSVLLSVAHGNEDQPTKSFKVSNYSAVEAARYVASCIARSAGVSVLCRFWRLTRTAHAGRPCRHVCKSDYMPEAHAISLSASDAVALHILLRPAPSMLVQNLKTLAANHMGEVPKIAVVAVPHHYTEKQTEALQSAVALSGIKVCRDARAYACDQATITCSDLDQT
jgi:hypothetical protein